MVVPSVHLKIINKKKLFKIEIIVKKVILEVDKSQVSWVYVSCCGGYSVVFTTQLPWKVTYLTKDRRCLLFLFIYVILFRAKI